MPAVATWIGPPLSGIGKPAAVAAVGGTRAVEFILDGCANRSVRVDPGRMQTARDQLGRYDFTSKPIRFSCFRGSENSPIVGHSSLRVRQS